MKNSLILVDFTATSSIALNQGKAIAKLKGSAITLCHVAKSYYGDIPVDLMKQMEPFEQILKIEKIPFKTVFGKGDFITEVSKLMEDLMPDLVLVGTHGKKGIKQNLFGSNIYKLIRSMKTPTLVLSDHSKTFSDGYEKILLPVAPHDNYLVKVKQASSLLKENGTIFIFAIVKASMELPTKVKDNIAVTKKYLDSVSVNWEYIEHDATKYSIGYSAETVQFASDHKMDMVSIMINVSEDNKHFGDMDKENVILNPHGTHVLCSI